MTLKVRAAAAICVVTGDSNAYDENKRTPPQQKRSPRYQQPNEFSNGN